MPLSTTDWEKINIAIETINTVSADEKMNRKNILVALRSLIYYDFGDFCYAVQQKDNSDISITNPVSLTKFPREFQIEYEFAYQHYYGQMDYTKWCLSSTESIAFRESDIISNEARLKTRFYNDFLAPRGLVHSMGCYIINEHYISTPCAIALYRDRSQPNFSKKDLQFLNILLPHIENRMAQQEKIDNPGSDKFNVDISARDLYLINKYGLTLREISVANEIVSGLSNADIAQHLNISIYTVKKHVSHILTKTETPNRIKLIHLLRDKP